MTTCDFTKSDTLKFIFCSKKGTPKNGTSRTWIYGSYPPPPGNKMTFLRNTGSSRKIKHNYHKSSIRATILRFFFIREISNYVFLSDSYDQTRSLITNKKIKLIIVNAFCSMARNQCFFQYGSKPGSLKRAKFTHFKTVDKMRFTLKDKLVFDLFDKQEFKNRSCNQTSLILKQEFLLETPGTSNPIS